MSFKGSTKGPFGSPFPAPSPDPQTFDGEQAIWAEEQDTEPIYIAQESGFEQLLSTSNWDGLSDPYSPEQSGWSLGPPEFDPYTNAEVSDALLGPYVGRDVEPYTNVSDDASANPYLDSSSIDPYVGLQPASSMSDGSAILAFSIDASVAEKPKIISTQSVYDNDGTYVGIQYTYSDGTTELHRFDDPLTSVVGGFDPVQVPTSPQPSAPPPASPQSALPQLPPPELPQLPSPITPPAPPSPAVQTVTEIVIVGERPFSPEVSEPAALQAARGMGHVELGDLEQLGRGGYNGLVDLLPLLAGPLLGPGVKSLNVPKAPIDPRYGGAAIMGEQLGQNLALEALAAIPALGRVLPGSVKGETVVVENLGQTAARMTEDAASIQELRDLGLIRPFSTEGVPQLPRASRAPTFSNKLKAIQLARDLTVAPGNIDEFGVIINEAGELSIGRGGPSGIELTNQGQTWVGHTHAPGGGSFDPSIQDIGSLPAGESEFFIDPGGRIHIIGRPSP